MKGQDAGDRPALQKSQTVEPEATGSQPDRQFSRIWQGLGVSTNRGRHEAQLREVLHGTLTSKAVGHKRFYSWMEKHPLPQDKQLSSKPGAKAAGLTGTHLCHRQNLAYYKPEVQFSG